MEISEEMATALQYAGGSIDDSFSEVMDGVMFVSKNKHSKSKMEMLNRFFREDQIAPIPIVGMKDDGRIVLYFC